MALFLLTDLILLTLVTTLPHSSLPPPLYSLPDTPQSRHTPANKAHHPELEPVGSSPKDKVVYPDSGHDWSGDPAPRDKACQSTRPDQFGRPSTNEAHPELVRSRLTGLSSSLCIVSAIDYNQLAFFLLANVLTGLVNFSLDTLHTAAPLAVCLLTLYMCVLVAVVLLLHRSRIKLKI